MQPKSDEARHRLGRKLLAAVLSEKFDLTSLDHSLRSCVPKRIDPSWAELGAKLLGEMTEDVERRLQQAKLQELRHERIHLAVDNTDLPF